MKETAIIRNGSSIPPFGSSGELVHRGGTSIFGEPFRHSRLAVHSFSSSLSEELPFCRRVPGVASWSNSGSIEQINRRKTISC